MSATHSPIMKGLSTQPPSTTKAVGAPPTLKFGKGYIGGDSEDSKIVVPSIKSSTTNTNTKKKGKSHASKRLESADFKRHASLEKISVSSNSTRAPKSPSEAFQDSITDGMPVQNSSLVAPSTRHRKKMISNDDMYDYRPPSEQSSISTATSAEMEPEARIDDAKAAAAATTAATSAAAGAASPAILPTSQLMSPKSPTSGRDGGGYLHVDMPLLRGNSHMSTVDLGTVQDSPDSSDSELASTRRFPKPSFLDAPVTPGMRRTSITLDRSPLRSPQGSMMIQQPINSSSTNQQQQQTSPPAPRRSTRSLHYDGGGGPLSAPDGSRMYTPHDGASQGGDSSGAVRVSHSGTPSDGTYNNSGEFALLSSTQPRGASATARDSLFVPMLALQQPTNPTSTTSPTSAQPPHATTTATLSGEELCHTVTIGKPTVRDLWVSSLSHPLSSLNTPTPVTTITHRLDDMWTQLFWTFLGLLFMCPLCTDVQDGGRWWPQAIIIGVVGVLGVLSGLLRLIPRSHIRSKPLAILLLLEPWLLTLLVCILLIVAPTYIFEESQGVNGVIGRFQSNFTTDVSSSLSITDVFSGRSTHALDGTRLEALLWRQLLVALEVTVLFLGAVFIERGRWQRNHNAMLSHWAMEVLVGGAVSTPEIAATATLAARTSSVINRSASSLRQRYQAAPPSSAATSSPPEPPSLGSGITTLPSSQHLNLLTTQQQPSPSPAHHEEGALAFITDKESSLPSNPPTLLVYVPPLVVGCALTGVYLGVHGTDTSPLMALLCALWVIFPIISLALQAVGVLLFSSPSSAPSQQQPTATRDRSRTVVLTDIHDPIPAKRPNKFATKKKYTSRLPVAASGRFSPRPNERFSHSTFHPIVAEHAVSVPPDPTSSALRRSETNLMGFPTATAAVPVRRRTLVSSMPSPGNTPAIRRAASVGGGIVDRDDTWVGRGFSRSYSPQRTHDNDESSFELSVGATPNDSPRRTMGSVNSPHLGPTLSSFARVQRATETNDYLYWSFQSPVNASLLQDQPSGSTAPGVDFIRFGDSLNHQNAHGSPPSKFSTALSLRRFYPLLFPGALPADGLVEPSIHDGSVGCPPSSFCGLADTQLLAPLAPAAALQLAHMCLSHLPLLSPQVSPYTVPTMLLSVDDHSIVMDCNIPFATVFGIEDPSFLVGRSMHSVMEWLGADDVVAAQELLTDVAFMPSVMQCAESGIASSRMLLLRTSGNDGRPVSGGGDGDGDGDMPPFGDGEMEVSEALGLGTTGGRGAVFLEAWKFAGEDVGGRMSLIRGSPVVPALTPTPTSTRTSPNDVDIKLDNKLDTGRSTSTGATNLATASVPSFVVLRQPMRHALVSHLPGVVCLANSTTAVIEAWSSGAVEATGLTAHDVLGRTMTDLLGVSMDDLFSTSSTKMNSGGGEVSGDGEDGTGVRVLLLPYVGAGTLQRNDGRIEHITVSITAWYPPSCTSFDSNNNTTTAAAKNRVYFTDANGDESASNRVMLLCTIALLDQQRQKELVLSRGSSPTEPMVGVPPTTRLSRHDMMSSTSSAKPNGGVPFMTPLSTGSYNAGSLRGMQRGSYRSQESSGSGNTNNNQDLMVALSRIVRDFNSRRGSGGVSSGDQASNSKELLIQFADNTMVALQEAASRSMRRGTATTENTINNIPPPLHSSNRSLSLLDSNNSQIRRDLLLPRTSLGGTSVNPSSPPSVINRIWPPPGVKAIRAPNDAPMDPLVGQTSLIFADTPWAKLVSRDTQLCDSADVAMTLKQEFQFGRSNKCHLTITDTFVSSVQFGIVRKLVKVDVDEGGTFSPEGSSKNKSSRSKRNSKVNISKTVVKVFLVDYSANGTYVNVKKIGKGKSVELSHSDLITFRLDNNRFFLGFKFELVEPFAATGVDPLGQSTVSMENLLAPGQPSQQQISPRNPGAAANNYNYNSQYQNQHQQALQPYNNNDYHPYPEHPDYSLPGGHGHMMGGGVGSVIEWKIGEEMIGKGGNAEVYLGMNITYGTLIAVKRVPLPKEMSGLRQYKALQEEIALLSNAQHPNIVQYYGSSQSDTHLNILLEFVPGGSLRHILDNFGNLAEGPIMRYLRQILAGLNYLHSIGIVHSDIKCANILVTEKGEVKLTDFGTAKPMKKEGDTSHDEEDKKGDSVAEATAAAVTGGDGEGEGGGGAEGGDAVMIVGTLLWMAPELCRAESSPSFSSDIWSLGCCLIEMFTAFYPWAEYEFESQEQIINLLTYTEEPPELPEPPSDTPQYRLLIDICSQCLSLDPNKRPTAAALLDTLYRFDQSQNPMMGRGGQVPQSSTSRPSTYPGHHPGMPPMLQSEMPRSQPQAPPSPAASVATFPRVGGGGGGNLSQGYHEQWGNSGGSATSRTSMRSGVLPPARGRSGGGVPQSDMEEMNRMVSDIEAARSAIRRV